MKDVYFTVLNRDTVIKVRYKTFTTKEAESIINHNQLSPHTIEYKDGTFFTIARKQIVRISILN